jgi:hypothetical protein
VSAYRAAAEDTGAASRRGASKSHTSQVARMQQEVQPAWASSCCSRTPAHLSASTVFSLQVANLLLLWLGSLPEPLFPQEYVPELLRTQQSDCYLDRVAAVRGFLKKVWHASRPGCWPAGPRGGLLSLGAGIFLLTAS